MFLVSPCPLGAIRPTRSLDLGWDSALDRRRVRAWASSDGGFAEYAIMSSAPGTARARTHTH